MNSPQDPLVKNNTAELEKQLADKTAELQRKDRELEIEASLEKVRGAAMSM